MYLDQVVRAAGRGGYAVVVWLAVRAVGGQRRRSASHEPRIAEITGLSERTIRKAVAALVEVGMLKRDGRKISAVVGEEN